MTAFEDEVAKNWSDFHKKWTKEIDANWTTLKSKDELLDSYRRIGSLNAFRTRIIEKRLDGESVAFFLEAQNDALISHVNASFGSWRTALQAMRSCIENVLCALYYRDHPIELTLWRKGKFRITFAELEKYFDRHPALSGISRSLSGLEAIAQEYATLSQAVHASASAFRMTNNISEVLLWNTSLLNFRSGEAGKSG